jgi:hypothetical protein
MSEILLTFRFSGAFLSRSIARSIVVATVLGSAGANLVAEDANRKSCTPLPSGAVSWWPGDGNTDDIIGSNHGQLVGGQSSFPDSLVKPLSSMALTTTSSPPLLGCPYQVPIEHWKCGRSWIRFSRRM